MPEFPTLWRWARFAIVGGLAALVYLAVSVGAVELGFTENRGLAIGVGLALSFCVAYLGHHGFTYRRSARHDRYLPRFIGAQAVIGGLMIGLVFGLTALGVAYWLANAVIVVIWPLVNLAASDLWIFNPDKEQRAG